MSFDAVDAGPARWERVARWTAFVVAFVAGLAVTVVAVRVAKDGVEPWASWRAAVRWDGFPVLVANAAWMVFGVLLQAPVALMRRAGLRWAAGATAVLVLFYLVVVAAAVLLSPVMSEMGDRRRGEDGGYPIILGVLLLVPVVFALSGAVFRRPVPGVRGWRVVFDDSFVVWQGAMLIGFAGFLLGVALEVAHQLGFPLLLAFSLAPVVGPAFLRYYRKVRDIVRRRQRGPGESRTGPGDLTPPALDG